MAWNRGTFDAVVATYSSDDRLRGDKVMVMIVEKSVGGEKKVDFRAAPNKRR
jgi:hypothetical protein